MELDELKRHDPRPFIRSKYGIQIRNNGSAHCPFHDDQDPSLSIYQKDGLWFWKCHAGCGHGHIVDFVAKKENISNEEAIQKLKYELGGNCNNSGRPKLQREHVYKDEHGQEIFKKVKAAKDESKWLFYRRDGKKWLLGKGNHEHLPYNLDKFRGKQQVIICEGEKDADTVNSLGIGKFATSAPCGCSSWPDEITKYFSHFEKITFLYDVGNEIHARKHASKLHTTFPKIEITIARVPSDTREFDITDYLEMQSDKAMALLDVLSREEGITFSDPLDNKTPRASSAIQVLAFPLSRFEIKPTKWLMKDRIPMNMVSALIADGGVGKSTFLVEVACRVSRNEPLPGSDRALVGGTVIYVTTENQPEEVFRPRAEACGGDLNKILYVRDVLVPSEETQSQVRTFDINKHLTGLEALICSNPDTRLVIIDPAISHVGDRLDPNSSLQVRNVIDLLSNFALRCGIAIIVVLHLSKNTGLASLHRAAGSHQWIASVRTAWAIAEDKADPDRQRRLLIPIKSNLATTRKSISFRIVPESIPNPKDPMTPIMTARVIFDEQEADINPDEFFNPDRQATETKTSAAIRFLNETLKDGPRAEVEVKELAIAAGINPSTLKYARGRIGIKSTKNGMSGGWFLSLPKYYDTSNASK